MTHEEKIKYMGVAVGVCGLGVSDLNLDMLVSIYDLVMEKKGDTDISSLCQVQVSAIERDAARHRSALLDKVSTKV